MQLVSYLRHFRALPVLLVSTLLVAACGIVPPASEPSSRAVVVEPRVDEQSAATVTPLDDRSSATSPWDYIAMARQASGELRHQYMLDAIDGFLDLGQSATARTLLEQLQAESLSQTMRVRAQLLLARSFFQEQQYDRVESTLQPLTTAAGLDADSSAQVMLLRARTMAASGKPESALQMLVAREPLLVDRAAVEENQNTIWRVLALLDEEGLNTLRADSTRQILAQWADLASLSQRYGWNTHELRGQLDRWQQLNPTHPASRVLIPGTLANLGDNLTQYRNVALLLPLTSGFGAAAQAVYDGFTMMYEADSNPRKPRVTLYDTGENPELIGFYYQAAVRDGAELVLGPLGKVAVDELVANTELTVPTLLLGNTDANHAGRLNVFQFGLSPEDEARQVARRAFDQGHRVAAVLYPETDWGVRQLDAFSTTWQSLGGTLAKTSVYQAEGQDHSQTIKLMLNLDESETRHREIQRIVGQPLEFVPKKRQDLDYIFMIARSGQGRLLKPQINFHAAQDVPVYAISQVYSGGDPVKDVDLDGVVFGDMPWIVRDFGVNRAIREELPEGDKYRNDPLDRLFAVGIDTYQMLFRLEAMRSNPQLEFRGTTGVLSLAADGTIVRRLDWARFADGEAEPMEWDSVLATRAGSAAR